MDLRERIYKLIEPRNKDTYASRMYDIVMLIAIVLGIFPLMFRAHYKLFWYFDLVSSICFIIDYILRWCTADYDSKRGKIAAFVIYPFTPMAIIDLLSILPIFNLLGPTFRVFRVSRMLKILRIFKVIRYFEPLEIIMAVIRKQSKVLMTVLSLAIFYIFITALIMFNAEEEINPETGEYTGDNSKSPVGRIITEEQFKNRMILRQAMLRHGFKPIDSEWWHFTLKDEPFPNTYFTFPVKQIKH